jgi:SCP-2 sterol transfer family
MTITATITCPHETISCRSTIEEKIKMSPEPYTASMFGTIQDLTASGERDVAKALRRLGDLLAPSQLNTTFQLQLVHDTIGEQTSSAGLMLADGKTTITSEPIDSPDVEIITTPETWWEIATGKLAPHDAFLGGRMRVRGDTSMAQNILKAAAPEGQRHLWTGGK